MLNSIAREGETQFHPDFAGNEWLIGGMALGGFLLLWRAFTNIAVGLQIAYRGGRR